MGTAPGQIRDVIVRFLSACEDAVSIHEIEAVVVRSLGDVPRSSIRSYLSINTPDLFERKGRGFYALKTQLGSRTKTPTARSPSFNSARIGNATIVHADCFAWMTARKAKSIHAVVTDPPYGLVEYSADQQEKLRNGNGGVWRIPPSFDGNVRSPLPRFTTLTEGDIARMSEFFEGFGLLLYKVLVPGGNLVMASNPLVSHYVAGALSRAGLEPRGTIVRTVMTMRGGDRPKNAHEEFPDVSVMPRSMWEPWLIFRRPLCGRVQDNLREWGTGGFRRISPNQPFGDIIKSRPTSKMEREIAPHPSLKPQAFLREVVRAALPLSTGMIFDPFAGSGSTLAAANYVGYRSTGTENDKNYFDIATKSISKLSAV